jgi:catechol 2,3-dioxygenase-like lactoylglutathione lyase family enzyme
MPKLYRVILPVSDIETAMRFYRRMLAVPGERVSPGRHYFDCGGTILACYDPKADGDESVLRPNAGYLYFSVPDVEATFTLARGAGFSQLDKSVVTRPWGERLFYGRDPFGNPIAFVDERTVFTTAKAQPDAPTCSGPPPVS